MKTSPLFKLARRCATASCRLAVLALVSLLGSKLAQADPFIVDGTGVLGPASLIVADDTYAAAGVTVINGGHLTIEPGARFGASAADTGYVNVYDTSTVVINGGVFGNTEGGGDVTLFDESTGIINGGRFGEDTASVYAVGRSTLTINGGEFPGASLHFRESSRGTINGGSGNLTRPIRIGGQANVTLNGGTFPQIFRELGTGNPSLRFNAASFDTSNLSRSSGGTLGVTFCGYLPQNITIVSSRTDRFRITLKEITCP